MLNILFTCAGRRNYLINYFKEALGDMGLVIAADAQLNAPALVDADRAELVPDIYDQAYIPTLIRLVKQHRINAIISLNDLELPILAENKGLLSEAGARVIVSDSQVINIAFDKWATARFITSIGLNSPKTYLELEEAKKALTKGELSFPLVLKPRFGSASIGIEFPESLEELELAYTLQMLKLQKSILKEASSGDMEHALIIQEKLGGQEYGMDVLNDFNGHYVGSFARLKLAMRSGETDKALSVIDPRFEAAGKVLGEKLGHIGSMDCDLFLDGDKVYVLELNPRFGGGYPFSHESGANIAGLYVHWLSGKKGTEDFNSYKAGLSFSKCDRLIRVN
jgi:carbamoyl-phosphate synthase large subunit